MEERLRGSGIKWVILRPGFFMQNTFAQAASIKNDGKIVLPFPADLPFAFIDVRDTGAVGARVLLIPHLTSARSSNLPERGAISANLRRCSRRSLAARLFMSR